VLDSLAQLYTLKGMYTRAGPLYQRASAIQRAALRENDPRVATLLTHRALFYAYQEQYAQAEALLQRALAIQETALGKHHPQVADSLRGLAQIRLVQHRLAEALPLLTRAFAISESQLRKAPRFSEPQLASMLWHLRSEEDLFYSLLRSFPADEGVRRLALTAVLLRKGRSSTEIASISRSSNELGTVESAAMERLKDLRSQLAALALRGRGELPPAEHEQRRKELAAQSTALQAAVSRRAALKRVLDDGPPHPDEIIERVTEGLPRDGALVEFIAYTAGPFLPKPRAGESKQAGPSHYLALVLFPNGETRATDLGPAEPIDRASLLLRDALARRDADFQASFQPLLPLLGNARRLFLSPDGQLGLIPFAALHDGRRFLVEPFDITYLTSGRDLLPRLVEELPLASSVVVLADPDFSARRSTPADAVSKPRAGAAGRTWTPLPGTRQEAMAIQRLIPQAQIFLGADATKERLLQLSAPGVLHVATHGFFLEDASAPESSRAVGQFGALSDDAPMQLPPEPLLRSGLVLAAAGAPAPGSSRAAQGWLDSSLITALELAGLNLWGTQLAVLSACDTGRGVVKQGQGVYGMRRALFLAGAETVVMSLWKVNDDTTRQLMEAYYRNLLEGQGRAAALREAMRALRLSHPHPHYWAPFIVLGRDSPLRGIELISQE
jgi:CHAT domain-containing protein/tetratricopeptide (TPR) repeat protein